MNAVLNGSEWRSAPMDSYAKFLMHAYQVLTLGRRFWRPIGVPVNKVKKGWSYPVNETIDASVFKRYAAHANYRPKNLLAWAERSHTVLSGSLGDQLSL